MSPRLPIKEVTSIPNPLSPMVVFTVLHFHFHFPTTIINAKYMSNKQKQSISQSPYMFMST